MVFSSMFFKTNHGNRINNLVKTINHSKRYSSNKADKVKFDFNLLEKIPFFSSIPKEQIVITPITQSSNNTNYKISVKNKHYVLRVPANHLDLVDNIDRKNEKINYEISANLGLCPQSIYFDAKTGIHFRPFVNGAVLTPKTVNENDVIKMAYMIKKIHNSSLLFANDINIQNLFNRYKCILEDRHFLGNKMLKTSFQLTNETIEVLYSYPFRLVPSHFDPHSANFIRSGQELFLLDWEFSGNTHPVWDLAFLSASFNLSMEEDDILLKNYYGNNLTTIEKHSMLVTKPLTEFFVAARMACILSIEHNQNLKKLQEASLMKTQNLFNDNIFQEALDVLKNNNKANVRYK